MVELLASLVGVGFLAMVGTFGYQAYLYLKYGEWIPMSVTYACGAYLEWDWRNFPQNWLGLHKILSEVNIGFFAFLAALIAFGIAAIAEGAK